MHAERRLTAFARALRLISIFLTFSTILGVVLIGSSLHRERYISRRRDIIFVSEKESLRTNEMGTSSSTLESGEGKESKYSSKSEEVDVETTNVTVVLENLEVDSNDDSAPWMYTSNHSPFVQTENRSESVFANTELSWNADGRGNGSCNSEGSGTVSRGYLDPYNYYLGLRTNPNFSEVRVELGNLSIADFKHINVVDDVGAWNVMGEAGDSRRYSHGTFRIFSDDKELLFANEVQWVQNVSYPGPIGNSQTGTFSISGYFVAMIEALRSDEEWVQRLDPKGTGFVLGVVTAASFGSSKCLSSNSYWITLRGFPDMRKGAPPSAAGILVGGGIRNGLKVGIYKGSSDRRIATARKLAVVSKAVVLTTIGAILGGTLVSTAVAVVAPGLTAGPPGQGLPRLLGTAAFVAKVNEIHGFHTDAMAEFGDGLKIFIGKVEWPFSEKTAVSRLAARSVLWLVGDAVGDGRQEGSKELVGVVSRQEGEGNVSVTEELFGGCAFYTTVIVLGFLLIHAVIWLATRKKPLSEQVPPHAWMIYIFSVVMSHVYTAAVLNSMQYVRSHAGTGTGKAGLYVVAVLQLLLIGIGFTGFFATILFLAVKRLSRKEVRWVPKEELADPESRRSAFIAGEYEGGNNTFHKLFECYYSSLSGPRVWLACLELFIVFLDAMLTAIIWNEMVCLGILVCVYAILFCSFLLLSPFVDKVEGGLVLVLGMLELFVLLLEFIGTLGDYDMAEKMEFGAMILGFVAIGFAVLIAVYCDAIPIMQSLWAGLARRLRKRVVVDGGRRSSSGSELESDWSGVSRSLSAATRTSTEARSTEEESGSMSGRGGGEEGIEDVVVKHNGEKEDEVRDMLSCMFGSGMIGRVGLNVTVSRSGCGCGGSGMKGDRDEMRWRENGEQDSGQDCTCVSRPRAEDGDC